MSTNFESAFHLSQLAHPILRASVASSHANEAPRSASIVMVSSVSGGPSTTNTGTVYAATKAAMNQFTRNVGTVDNLPFRSFVGSVSRATGAQYWESR